MMSLTMKNQCKKGMEILDIVYDIAVNNSAVSQTANQLANEFLEQYNRDVKKAPVYESDKAEPFDRNSVKKVAERG